MIAGRYSLDREIGRGGTGVVWLGRDEVLGRQVALKRIGLLPGADRTDLARAEREARLSARLNHPHVVAIYDVVVDPEADAHWLVMEYVDGVTLGQLVERQGRLSLDDAAPLLWQAADALVAAHAAGIAHRDVKPSNILINQRRLVKLTDFGIARIATDPSLTQTGMVTGSPGYLAPEIATGGGSDEAADVWSLGVTTFHLLAGRPPYEIGDNVLGALYRIVNEEPPRLADAGWMSPLLAGTMVRDPARRWSMEEVRDFLADPASRLSPTTGVRVAVGPVGPVGDPTRIQPVAGQVATSAPPAYAPSTAVGRPRPSPRVLLVGLALSLVLGLVLYAVLAGRDPAPESTARTSGTTSSPSGQPSPSRGPSPSSEPSPRAAPAKPTAKGMENFIRDYVRAVASDPTTSWRMLTPKFQRQSGGLERYRSFWDDATNGRVLSISANPRDLAVSYQVRFDNFDNAPGPTVLDLKFDGTRYLIDGERSEGFVPAG